MQQHDADHVVLIKVNVYDLAFGELRAVGVPVVDRRILFPGSGRQREFHAEMGAVLDAIDWRCP